MKITMHFLLSYITVELIPTLLLRSEGLVGGNNNTFYILTEILILSFIMIISLSLHKREIIPKGFLWKREFLMKRKQMLS